MFVDTYQEPDLEAPNLCTHKDTFNDVNTLRNMKSKGTPSGHEGVQAPEDAYKEADLEAPSVSQETSVVAAALAWSVALCL